LHVVEAADLEDRGVGIVPAFLGTEGGVFAVLDPLRSRKESTVVVKNNNGRKEAEGGTLTINQCKRR
jgi:hypothetical protein